MSIFDKAREKLNDNKFSIESWNILIKEAQDNKIEKSRDFFEELILNFPTARFWKIYIEQETKYKNFDSTEKLYARSLNSTIHIDLWKSYLVFFKETRASNENFNQLMTNEYERALHKVGLDVLSYSIWFDYLNHLKSLENSTESKEKLHNDILKVFGSALKTPMVNIDQIWKDYCQYLNTSDNTQCPPDEAQKNFQFIKKISREYETVTRQIDRYWLILPLDQVTNFDEEFKQLQVWKRYILWEKQNPLKLESPKAIMDRVMYAYDQCLTCMSYHCDVWLGAANYLITLSKTEGVKDSSLKKIIEGQLAEIYKKAVNNFMKNNTLIYLAYANFEENRLNYQKAYEIYERCIQNGQINEPTLAWIHYIRFARRREDIVAARKLFRRAREDPRSTYHLFIAKAHLEYFCTKDKAIGFKIFHLGAKKYSNEPEYIMAYLKYMAHLNEDNNTRVLYERILSSDELPSKNTNEIWSEFLKFECGVGDLASILKVDKKRQKFYESTQSSSDWSESILLIDRYKYLDLLPCTLNELKSIGYKDIPTAQSSVLNQLSLFSNNGISSEFTNMAANEIKKSKFPQPDITQMLPFKPVRNSLPMLHSIAGGVFPFPPAVTELVKRLPPPTTFEGPFVKIDELLKSFQSIEIKNESIMTEDGQMAYVYINGEPIKEIDHVTSLQGSNSGQIGLKRSMNSSANSDDEDSKKGKTMDIYKQRQYKKLMQNTL